MRKARGQRSRKIGLPSLIVLSWLLCCVPVHGGGLDWGDYGDSGDETACTPDNPLVIVPGPLGSPVRLTRFDEQTYLVADYSRKTIFQIDPSGIPSPIITTIGKPLSLAFKSVYKKNNILKETNYYIGNDDGRSIDVYRVKKGMVELTYRYFVVENGIQALDMVLAGALNQLFVVDGTAQDIKVVQLDGVLLRSFGGGVLSSPKGIAIDTLTGEVFVSDYGDSSVGIPASIQVFGLDGSLQRTIAGAFSRPQGLALTSDRLFVTDNMLAQVLEFDRTTGEKIKAHSCKGSSEGHLLLPMDVVVDDAGLNLFVADNRNMRVTILSLTEGQ